ncbi:hypothetical protein Hanom_Chr04g00286731 [Helianthus anomalus]
MIRSTTFINELQLLTALLQYQSITIELLQTGPQTNRTITKNPELFNYCFYHITRLH